MTKEQNDFLYVVQFHAVRLAYRQGGSRIPPSVTIAQAILESNWGTSVLATKAHNLFGIKAGGTWTGPTYEVLTGEVIHGKAIQVRARFRKYDGWIRSIEDHDVFLQRSVYAAARQYRGNGIKYAEAIAKCGYATDPKYPLKLKEIIEKYDLLKYDKRDDPGV